MDIEQIVNQTLDELVLVSKFEPNERLPKEEQVRCSIYAAIRPEFDVVCAERGYDSINKGSRIEVDLWAYKRGVVPVWIEIKRCWAVRRTGWNNNVSEKLREWDADLLKLAREAQLADDRYFVLIGFFSDDPAHADFGLRHPVVRAIDAFHPANRICSTARAFTWLLDDGIAHLGAWAWYWPAGRPIQASDGMA